MGAQAGAVPSEAGGEGVQVLAGLPGEVGKAFTVEGDGLEEVGIAADREGVLCEEPAQDLRLGTGGVGGQNVAVEGVQREGARAAAVVPKSVPENRSEPGPEGAAAEGVDVLEGLNERIRSQFFGLVGIAAKISGVMEQGREVIGVERVHYAASRLSLHGVPR